MTFIAALLSVVLHAVTSTPGEVPRTETVHFDTPSHAVVVTVTTRPFDRAAHTISEGPGGVSVDGKCALGTDCGIPSREIVAMVVFFDGQRIALPKRLFADCYNPNFKPGYFTARPTDDSAALVLAMSGSDAAGGYGVLWFVPKSGRPTRVSNACSDCECLLDLF